MPSPITWNFSPGQLATWDQARKLALEIAQFSIDTGNLMGGGVMAETDDPNTSGIFVPSWDGGPGGFPEPNDAAGGSYWLHFRFANAKVLNVGLIQDKVTRYGGNVRYVFGSLSGDLYS